jgi:hypothetical protein
MASRQPGRCHWRHESGRVLRDFGELLDPDRLLNDRALAAFEGRRGQQFTR